MNKSNAIAELIDLSAEQINELARCFWYSSILRAGIKLGVFDVLDGGLFSAEEVERRVGIDPNYVEAYLDACEVLDLLEKNGDKYANTATTSKFLVKGKEEYVGDHAMHHTNTWALWGRLDEILKEGKSQLPFETGYVDEVTYWTDYMIGQHNRAASGQAHYLVDNVDLTGRRKMLDLGGGAASYSIALCGANPQLHAVVVDQKEPLAVARPLVAEHNLQHQIELREGDFFGLELENDYDVVLISGVVLITSEEESRDLFKLAYDRLSPGGLVIVQDYMRLDHSPERKRLDSLENLYVKVAFSPKAADREGDEIASWLLDTGFTNLKRVPVPTQLAIMTAQRLG